MRDPRQRRWESLTVATLFVGYVGYYICRSNFSVCRPLLLEEFGPGGMTKETIGQVASIGTFCYAMGKFTTGVANDFIGGRRMFLFGMLGSILCTLFFGLGSGLLVFTLAWAGNRLIQSVGWGALVKISANWLSFERYGRMMGVLTLSYLFGDAAAKWYLGALMDAGLGWREVFFAAAASLAAILLAATFILRSSPKDVGLPEPDVNPANLFGEAGREERARGLFELLAPFLSSFSFWMVLVMSLGLTFIRETLNDWLPTFLHESAGLEPALAARYSAVFPLAGGVSAVLCGLFADRLAGGQKGPVMAAFLAGLVAALYAFSQLLGDASIGASVALIAIIGLCMTGPYTFLSGAISLDLGGKKASSTAAGLADGVGYLGGTLAGFGVGRIADQFGWKSVFLLLAAVAFVSVLAGIAYLIAQAGRAPARSASLKATRT